MKFDEIEKVETVSYPKNNIIREETGVKRRRSGRAGKGKALDVAVVGSIFSALAAVVMLMTSIVSMAADGILGEVFKLIL